MEYNEHPVPAILSGAVRCLWTLRGDPGAVSPEPQPVLPDGCAELILNSAEPFEEWEEGAWRKQPVRFLYGQITQAIRLRPAGATAMIGVRFHPWGVHRLFGADAVAEGKTPLDLIDGAMDQSMSVSLRDRPFPDAVPVVIGALAERPQQPVEPALLRFIQALQDPEAGPLERLKAEVPLSERQLERRFLAVVGLRPKLLARIIRLRRAIDLLHGGDVKGFAALAHAAGYFDQAHFNRDLKAFTGMPPRAYFKQDLLLPEYFSGVR
ncbi:MAG TPA: helix-turn-helix domain-containing protein [Flavobacteriales bacterium]